MSIPFEESEFEKLVREDLKPVRWDLNVGIDTTGYVINCPFCGADFNKLICWQESEDAENEIGAYWYIICDNCQCKGPESPTEQGACNLWNERRGD